MLETSLLVPPVQLPSCPQAPQGPVPNGVLPFSHRGTTSSSETPSQHHLPTSQAPHQHPCPGQLPETHQR